MNYMLCFYTNNSGRFWKCTGIEVLTKPCRTWWFRNSFLRLYPKTRNYFPRIPHLRTVSKSQKRVCICEESNAPPYTKEISSLNFLQRYIQLSANSSCIPRLLQLSSAFLLGLCKAPRSPFSKFSDSSHSIRLCRKELAALRINPKLPVVISKTKLYAFYMTNSTWKCISSVKISWHLRFAPKNNSRIIFFLDV